MKKGSKMTEEQRQRVSRAQKKRMSNPLERERFLKVRVTNAWLGKKHSEETKRKISETLKGTIPWISGKHHTPEALEKMGLAHKGQHTKGEFKKGQTPRLKGKHQSEEAKRKMSIGHKGKRASPKTEFKKGLVPWNKEKTGVYSKETKKKMSESWRKTFLSNPEISKKMREHRATQIFPVKDSKPEIKIQNFLKELGIVFLTHKYMRIKHSYQCDIFIPSMNLVIECDGDYWHGNSNSYSDEDLSERIIKQKEIDPIRTKELQEKGFNVLRFWGSDIEKMNLKDFIGKIKPFQQP